MGVLARNEMALSSTVVAPLLGFPINDFQILDQVCYLLISINLNPKFFGGQIEKRKDMVWALPVVLAG